MPVRAFASNWAIHRRRLVDDLAKVASNHAMWRFVTAPAVATDIANHVLTETGLKDPLLHDVGLGWAAGAGG